ncbi:hypothetical protein, partial [Sandarakinorhabdus oryzae]|uniref:hypothetical protein n=1 Tax=Sandarakinorhabdus oryzae TaxID=2675220 RepID=UPI001A9C773D
MQGLARAIRRGRSGRSGRRLAAGSLALLGATAFAAPALAQVNPGAPARPPTAQELNRAPPPAALPQQ